MANDADACRIALTFPEAMQSGSGFEIRKKGFAWFYQEKIAGQKGRVERRDVLAIRVAGQEEKEMLIVSDPETFFTTPHYNGFPAVLVRLPAIEIDDLTALLTDAWRIQAPKKLSAAFDAASDSRYQA